MARKIDNDFVTLAASLHQGKEYDSEIDKLRKKSISQTLKDKLTDKKFNKSKAFEDIKCNHKTYTALTLAKCKRCQFNIREIEAENLINNLNGNEQTEVMNDDVLETQILHSLVIKRGSLDDVQAFEWSWK